MTTSNPPMVNERVRKVTHDLRRKQEDEKEQRRLAALRTPPSVTMAVRKTETEAERGSRLKYYYRMTLEEYDFLLEAQGGHCAICPKTPEENGKRLAVDHDHRCCPGKESCGKCIRGLLCAHCNLAIGLLEDNPLVMENAADYIRFYTND
jgi:Recombination endonuclease VII